MFNERRFRERLFREGYTKEKLAGVLGINQATLYRKINGKSEFTRIEMQLVQNALHLSREELCSIFFAD
jgi:transcriptional regulator with XRE-family HTH domain